MKTTNISDFYRKFSAEKSINSTKETKTLVLTPNILRELAQAAPASSEWSNGWY